MKPASNLTAESATPFSASCNILTFCSIALKQHLSFGAMLVFDNSNKSLSSSSRTSKVWYLLREDRRLSHTEIKMSTLFPKELWEEVVFWFCAPAWTSLPPSSDNPGKPQPRPQHRGRIWPEHKLALRWPGLGRGGELSHPSSFSDLT